MEKQGVLRQAFDVDTNQINTNVIGAASANRGTDKDEQWIWNAVFDSATNSIRVVVV